MYGTSRERKGTSTPGQMRATRRMPTVTSTATARKTSVRLSKANPQSVGKLPFSNHVSWAKGTGKGMPGKLDTRRPGGVRADYSGRLRETRSSRQRGDWQGCRG